MIREELLHPAISHFPIAFLVLATALKLILLFKEDERILFTARVLLYLGTFLILPTLFLGDMALDIVKNDLCRLTLAHEHEELGELTLIIFIIGAALDVALNFKLPYKSLVKYLGFIALLFGCGVLFETAEHGGELVYEDGAAVTRELGPCPK